MITCHAQDVWFAVLAAASYGAVALQHVAADNPLKQQQWRYLLWSFAPFSLFAVQASDCSIFILLPAFLLVIMITIDVGGIRKTIASAVQRSRLTQQVLASQVVLIGAGMGLFIALFYFVYQGWLVRRGLFP